MGWKISQVPVYKLKDGVCSTLHCLLITVIRSLEDNSERLSHVNWCESQNVYCTLYRIWIIMFNGNGMNQSDSRKSKNQSWTTEKISNTSMVFVIVNEQLFICNPKSDYSIIIRWPNEVHILWPVFIRIRSRKIDRKWMKLDRFIFFYRSCKFSIQLFLTFLC